MFSVASLTALSGPAMPGTVQAPLHPLPVRAPAASGATPPPAGSASPATPTTTPTPPRILPRGSLVDLSV